MPSVPRKPTIVVIPASMTCDSCAFGVLLYGPISPPKEAKLMDKRELNKQKPNLRRLRACVGLLFLVQHMPLVRLLQKQKEDN